MTSCPCKAEIRLHSKPPWHRGLRHWKDRNLPLLRRHRESRIRSNFLKSEKFGDSSASMRTAPCIRAVVELASPATVSFPWNAVGPRLEPWETNTFPLRSPPLRTVNGPDTVTSVIRFTQCGSSVSRHYGRYVFCDQARPGSHCCGGRHRQKRENSYKIELKRY